jgi:hypothetical protein
MIIPSSISMFLFQQFPISHFFQHFFCSPFPEVTIEHPLDVLHVLDSYLVQFMQAVALRDALVDKHRILILHIGEADKLVDSSIVAHAVTSHELICSPLDFASARHPKGPLSKATGFLHILP